MSHEWGYICKRDGAILEPNFNHGERMLSVLVSLCPLIKQLKEADTTGIIDMSLRGHSWHSEEIWIYLTEHAEHGLELIDEYGKIEPLKEI